MADNKHVSFSFLPFLGYLVFRQSEISARWQSEKVAAYKRQF
jgi:hypothetical protein